MKNTAPRALEEALSPAWLSAALGVEIDSVAEVETLCTTATKVRFRAVTAEGSEHGYCLKGIFGDGPLHPGHARISQDESRFYRDFAPITAVNTPRCRYDAIDESTGHGLIIMDDVVAEGGRFLTALEPYTADQAHRSLDQLATLHAEHWAGTGLGATPWVRSRLSDLVSTPLQRVDALQLLVDDARGAPLSPAILDARRIHRALAALAEAVGGHTETLVHGDAHAGNLFVRDGGIALIDWQLVQRSSWAIDVAYHVGAALAVRDRQRFERELLDHYLDRLAAHGVATPPGREEAWTAYRAGMAYGYYLWANTRRVEPMIIHEFCLRLGTAVSDLASFEVLDV